MTQLLPRFRRNENTEAKRAELIADLIRRDLLEQKLTLTKKSKKILARDPQTIGDQYWTPDAVDARKAYALVHGTSVTTAAIG